MSDRINLAEDLRKKIKMLAFINDITMHELVRQALECGLEELQKRGQIKTSLKTLKSPRLLPLTTDLGSITFGNMPEQEILRRCKAAGYKVITLRKNGEKLKAAVMWQRGQRLVVRPISRLGKGVVRYGRRLYLIRPMDEIDGELVRVDLIPFSHEDKV